MSTKSQAVTLGSFLLHGTMTTPYSALPRPFPAISETSHDMCAGLRITPTTLRLWEKTGRIPTPARVGKRKLWAPGTVERLLAAHAGGAQ